VNVCHFQEIFVLFHLKTIMGFIGVDMLDSIIAEGMAYDPTNAEAIKQAAIELSQQAASALALV
jgi:FMN-dependent NADH-azoreductase